MPVKDNVKNLLKMSKLLKSVSVTALFGSALLLSGSLIGSNKNSSAFNNSDSAHSVDPRYSAAQYAHLLADSAILGEGLIEGGLPLIGSTNGNTEANSNSVAAEAAAVYTTIKELKPSGLSQKAFEYAWKGYQHLLNKDLLSRQNILTICDFSQSSRQKRLYIIDVATKKLLLNTYVAHGRNSGAEYAQTFSNTPQSYKSSLGFYVTRKTYQGEHGLALRIDGLEKGFNDKADERNIVVHGCDYVGPRHLRNNPYNGRSFGCPAVPASETSKIINTIKNGSCLFIYHPSDKYLNQSKLLNG